MSEDREKGKKTKKRNEKNGRVEKEVNENKTDTVIPIEETDREAKRREESQRAYEENYEAEEKDWKRAWKILKNTITITMPCLFGDDQTFHYKTFVAYSITILFLLYIWITRLQEEIYCCYYMLILNIIGVPFHNKGCDNDDGKGPTC